MSTTLSTTQMVAKLQRKFPLGLGSSDCMDFLNEAFRKIDQMSKGGFIWQLNTTSINLPSGAATQINLPADFDPGKSAWLSGTNVSAGYSPTLTEIPYKPYKEFVNQQHFQVTGSANFSCWTCIPNFSIGPPLTFGAYTLKLAPTSAYPLANNLIMSFLYHSVNFPPLAISPSTYFPTPDQFDSLIVDIAEAELARVYKVSGYDTLMQSAITAVQNIIDTYRTDRYDLAGLTDQMAQAQEKQAERAK